VANITAPNPPAQLTEHQLLQFGELASLVGTASESERATTFRNICDFLNETVCPVEQARALQIPFDLYKSIVAIRKENADNQTISGRISTVRHICKEINRSEGVFVKDAPEDIGLSPDEFIEASRFLNIAREANNNEKNSGS